MGDHEGAGLPYMAPYSQMGPIFRERGVLRIGNCGRGADRVDPFPNRIGNVLFHPDCRAPICS